MSADDIVARLREAFAEVPRPGIPLNYVPDGTLGNPGWDEFTYHSALVFAEQVPDHVQRALDSPEKYVPDLLWHLSDSERLGVFSNRQIALLARGASTRSRRSIPERDQGPAGAVPLAESGGRSRGSQPPRVSMDPAGRPRSSDATRGRRASDRRLHPRATYVPAF